MMKLGTQLKELEKLSNKIKSYQNKVEEKHMEEGKHTGTGIEVTAENNQNVDGRMEKVTVKVLSKVDTVEKDPATRDT